METTGGATILHDDHAQAVGKAGDLGSVRPSGWRFSHDDTAPEGQSQAAKSRQEARHRFLFLVEGRQSWRNAS